MAIIPTVDVIVNSDSNTETGQMGRGMVTMLPTGRNGNFVYNPSPLSDRVKILSSGDYLATEAQYDRRFEYPV